MVNGGGGGATLERQSAAPLVIGGQRGSRFLFPQEVKYPVPNSKDAQVITMRQRKDEQPEVVTPWAALGFATERDMLLDDLKTLDGRIKSPATTATAVAALSKRKQEVFEQIKHLDSGESDLDVLDDSEDEAWNAGG